MGLLGKIRDAISGTAPSVRQSRDIAAKLHDSHVKYASENIGGTDTIIGRDGHLNVVDGDKFELTFGVTSAFKALIDEMQIWEFMSLDGAVVTGTDLNSGIMRTVTVYYDKHL